MDDRLGIRGAPIGVNPSGLSLKIFQWNMLALMISITESIVPQLFSEGKWVFKMILPDGWKCDFGF